MITTVYPLSQLLALIDMVWIDAERHGVRRGRPNLYSEKTLFKGNVVSLLKKLWARPSVVTLDYHVPRKARGVGRIVA